MAAKKKNVRADVGKKTDQLKVNQLNFHTTTNYETNPFIIKTVVSFPDKAGRDVHPAGVNRGP